MPSLTVVILFFTFAALATSTASYARTLLPGDAYLVYPLWLTSTQGKIELTIKTSVSNVTLLYIAGKGERHLHLSLNAGRLACSFQPGNIPKKQMTKRHWNDDLWHKITIIHISGRIEVDVDGNQELHLVNTTALVFDTLPPTYIGGVPSRHSQGRYQSLQGCIREVRMLNNSFTQYGHKTTHLIAQNRSMKGCHGPCEVNNKTCNDGQCIGNWLTGQTICLCPPLTTGEHCQQKLLNTPTVMNGKSYRCQSMKSINEPYVSLHLALSVSPPIPANGAIMSMHADRYSAILYLDNYRPVYSIYTRENKVTTIHTDVKLLAVQHYILSVNRTGQLLYFTIQAGKNSNRVYSIIPPHETMEGQAWLVCIGGGAIGLPIYKGVLSAATYQGMSLLAQKSADLVVIPKTIIFIPGDGIVYIPLWNSHLSSGDLTFKVWMERAGSLLSCQNGSYTLDIQIAKGCIQVIGHYTDNKLSYECKYNVISKKWYSFQVGLRYGLDSITLQLSVDNLLCSVTGEKWASFLQNVVSAPLNLGKVNKHNNAMFKGYIGNVTVGQASSMVNLEAAELLAKNYISPKADIMSDIGPVTSIRVTLHDTTASVPPPLITKSPQVSVVFNTHFTSTRDFEKAGNIILCTFSGVAVVIIMFITVTTTLICCYIIRVSHTVGDYYTGEEISKCYVSPLKHNTNSIVSVSTSSLKPNAKKEFFV